MMKYIELTRKRRGLAQEALDTQNSALYARLRQEATLTEEAMAAGKTKGSTGSNGKYAEPIVRHLLTAHGLTADDMHARTNGSNTHVVEDGVLYIQGARVKYDVKTGDGIVGYIEPTAHPTWTEDDILPELDLVIYACEVESFASEDDVLDGFIVLTRAEFLEFISVNGPKRKQNPITATKAATNGKDLRYYNKHAEEKLRDCITLQPAYRAARAAACESGMYLSLRSFLQDIGRA